MAHRSALQWMVLVAFIFCGMLILTSLPLFAFPLQVPSNTIVISQIYGAGGNSGAPYQNDFIELFNRGGTTINVTGWTVQYAPATSSSWASTTLAGSIAPGQYFLVKQGSGGANGVPLPTANVTGTVNMAAAAGKVALVNNAVALGGTCPVTSTNVIDFVGYGSAICFEGTGTAPSNSTAVRRMAYGCTETDNNPTDFWAGAPRPHNTSSPILSCSLTAEPLLITEVLYDGTQTEEGDEFIEIFNPTPRGVDLSYYKIGDEETKGGGEGMYEFPMTATIASNQIVVVARNAAQFRARFGFDPQYELPATSALTDTLSVPNLDKYGAWATGSLALANDGDEMLLLGPGDQIVDSVAWENGNYTAVGLYFDPDDKAKPNASEPQSLQRYGTDDRNQMNFDFLHGAPSPGTLVMPPTPPAPPPGVAMPNGMFAYWGDIHSHSTMSDGSGPPRMAFATARANGLHFFALTDHDAWLTQDGTEWNEMGSAANSANVDGAFVALRGFEYSNETEGHINVFGTTTWVSRDDPNYDTLTKFYAWLAAQTNAIAQFNHPDPNYGGTFYNFAFNAAAASKIFMQEVGNNGRGYVRYEPQYPQSLNKGWHVAPTNNSDNHELNWGSDSPHRTGIIAPSLTQANVLNAFRARRVFATEDKNLALALQSNGAWMGSTITSQPTINFTVTARDPDAEAITLELYDNGTRVAVQAFLNNPNVTWNVSVAGKPLHYYYARAVQSGDGDIAYTAPIWTVAPPSTPVPPTETSRDNQRGSGNILVTTPQPTPTLQSWLEGCVTVPPNVLSSRVIYIQNANQGLRVNLSRGNFPPLKLGDRVALRGIGADKWSAHAIEIDDPGIIETRGSCGTVMPISYATGTVDRTIESLLIEVRGTVANTRTGEIELSDGSGSAFIVIDPATRISVSTAFRGQSVRAAGVVMYQNNRVIIVPRYASDLTLPRATATPTRTRTTPQVTATRRNTPAVSPTSRATRTPTPLRRSELIPLNEEFAQVMDDASLGAQSVAVVGGSTSIATGFACFALALALWRRQRR